MSFIELELIEELFSQPEKKEILRRLRNAPPPWDVESLATPESAFATPDVAELYLNEAIRLRRATSG